MKGWGKQSCGAAPAFFLASLLSGGCSSTGVVSADASEKSTLAAHLPAADRRIIAQQFKASPAYQSVEIKNAQISNPITQWGAVLDGGTIASVCVRYQTSGLFGTGPAVDWFGFTKMRLNRPL